MAIRIELENTLGSLAFGNQRHRGSIVAHESGGCPKRSHLGRRYRGSQERRLPTDEHG